MPRMNLFAVAVLLLTTGAAAYGQKVEASFLVGGMKTGSRSIASGGSVDVGTSATYELNVATRLVDAKLASLHFEVPLVIAPSSDLNSSNVLVPKSYSAWFLTPGLKLKISPISPFSPYVVLGAGIGHFNSSEMNQSGQANTGSRGATRGVFDFGGGVDIKVIPFVALRGEVRDIVSGNPNFNAAVSGSRQHNVLVAGGVVLRF